MLSVEPFNPQNLKRAIALVYGNGKQDELICLDPTKSHREVANTTPAMVDDEKLHLPLDLLEGGRAGWKLSKAKQIELQSLLDAKEIGMFHEKLKQYGLGDRLDPTWGYHGNKTKQQAQGLEIIYKDANYHVFPIPIVKSPADNNGSLFRQVYYVTAPSGAGKTTFCATYIKLWLRLQGGDIKKNPVYVISRVARDPALDSIKGIERIMIDENLLDEQGNCTLSADDFKHALVLFDDIDTIPSKPLAKCVQGLRDDLLETGRHCLTYVLCTSHQIMNWKATRACLNESSCVTFFPKSGGVYAVQRFLVNYCGLSRKQIDRIMALPTRWCTIYRGYPNYVVHEGGVYLL